MIYPLTEDEYKQLEKNIIADGKIISPIITWHGTILDGHNRWKIIQSHPEINIPYTTEEMPFDNKWEVIAWMCDHQTGQRNLTPEQKMDLIGRRFEAEKHITRGGQNGNTNASKKRLPQNDGIVFGQGTAAKIAQEYGIGKATVERAEKYSKGIDAIRAQSPTAANDILTGKIKIPKSDVQKIGTAKPEERDNLAKAVVEGKPLPVKNPEPAPTFNFDKPISTRSKEGRQLMERIRADVERQTDGKLEEITLSDFSEMLECDVQSMIERLTDVLSSKRIITKSIAKQTEASIKQLTKLKEVLNDVRIPA